MSTVSVALSKTPWHLWAVAILTLLWNGSGAFTIMMAQAGRLPNIDANEAAYYAAQPPWFVITTGIALLSPVAAAIALLLRSRAALWLFAAGVVAIVANNVYDFAVGASLALVDRGWMILTAITVAIAVLQLLYARAMRQRGVLR